MKIVVDIPFNALQNDAILGALELLEQASKGENSTPSKPLDEIAAEKELSKAYEEAGLKIPSRFRQSKESKQAGQSRIEWMEQEKRYIEQNGKRKEDEWQEKVSLPKVKDVDCF